MTDNRALALSTIARFTDAPLGHFIAGQAVPGEGTLFDIFEPGTGGVLGQCADATEDQLEAAVAAARDAFPIWSATPPGERRRILNRMADLIVERADEIAAVECLDAGQCWRFMSKAAIRGAENFRFFGDLAPAAA
ncbi:MAG: aldehyde dehydrogenase family protein, partial [Sphingorhabdus sp.]